MCSITHPLPIGQSFLIWNLVPIRLPFVEGLAVIIAPIPGLADAYWVRFKGERLLRRRFVHAGAWQDDRHQLHSALRQFHRVAVDPSLLRDVPSVNL